MTPRSSKKIEIAIFVAALAALVAIWAANGYENDWLYAMSLILIMAIPTSWLYRYWSKKNKGQ